MDDARQERQEIENYRAALRSRTSHRHAYVRFVNATQRKVDVIWINYEGVRVKYKTLEANEYFDVTSFVSHPWIFRDSETQTKLVVRQQEVFDCPEPIFVKLREGMVKPTRSVVTITLPVYSLKECAMQAIQRSLVRPDDAYKLEIPKVLQKEVQNRCRQSYRNRQPTTLTIQN